MLWEAAGTSTGPDADVREHLSVYAAVNSSKPPLGFQLQKIIALVVALSFSGGSVANACTVSGG
jgi:hypothetical protein